MKNQSGMSLVGVMVAIGLSGALAIIVMKQTSMQFALNSRISDDADLNFIKQNLVQGLDCKETVPDIETCDTNKLYILKARGGRDLFPLGTENGTQKSGKWVLKTKCADDGLVISSTRSGIDPLTKQTRKKSNIFSGMSALCSLRFSGANPNPCSGKYNIPGGKETCCRLVIDKKSEGDGKPDRWPPNSSIARATCDSDEYLLNGGGRCQSGPDTDNEFTFHVLTGPDEILMHTSEPYINGAGMPAGWWTDCQGRVTAKAFATCCPIE